MADNNKAYYYHFDGLGSVVALSNSNGDSCQSYQYSVYGQVAASDPNHPNPYMFTGRRFDIETGLYYYRARYYNPHIGRFMQTDPVGYDDGINWYAYCGNNPLAYVDPSGSIIKRRNPDSYSAIFNKPFVIIERSWFDADEQVHKYFTDVYQVSDVDMLYNLIFHDPCHPDSRIISLRIIGHGNNGMLRVGDETLTGNPKIAGAHENIPQRLFMFGDAHLRYCETAGLDPKYNTLFGLFSKTFDPNCVINLDFCESAQEGLMSTASVGLSFKYFLPGARVFGWTWWARAHPTNDEMSKWIMIGWRKTEIE